MRRYNRPQNQPPSIWKVQKGNILPEELDELVRSYDGTEVVQSAKPPDEIVVHNLNGVKITRHWRTTPRDKGFVFEVFWRQGYWTGRSVHDALRKVRATFPKPVKQVVGEIMAVRGWRVIGDMLRSVSAQAIWEGPIVHADVAPDFDSARPFTGSTSGIYAVKPTPNMIRALIRDYHPDAYGFVGLYGRVVEHANGYRAQHCIVRRIILRFPASEAYVKLLADRYECDVVIEKGFRR